MLRLSRRGETWKAAEILILRHQLAVLQRRQPDRPKLNWADRALLTTLLAVIPNTRLCGARTRAEHLTSASTLGTRAHSPRLPVHGPVVRLAGAPRAEQHLKGRGDLGPAARGCGPAPSGRPPEAGLGRPVGAETYATWADALGIAVGSVRRLGVGRAGLGSAGGGMIFGLWA